ncbi:DUF3558 domain-containing protein [Amycolatopsis azurea]|uniref:DUF3558 domain-containing protein n=1 Tax=Amycolatopsis azurea DSM 43854 TaxID=1238180 RepID=A0ABX3JH48_9PSEU|nr:DUF3558 family protein [Amycolatopsis azurea]OOC07063.1 hypothetical protein B0293_08290 [Amycolatopsis azurea DSM 43854]
MTVAALAVSCSSEKQSTSSPAPVSSVPFSSEKNQEVFAGMDSCEVLRSTTSESTFESYNPETLESDNGCRAEKARYGNVALYFVGNEGIDGLQSNKGAKISTKVAGREAVRLAGAAGQGNCFIGISVTSRSRATVNLTLSNGSDDQACTDAEVIAEKLAPKLPQGN